MTNQSSGPLLPMLLLIPVAIVIGLGLYIFYSYCLKIICEKTGKKPGVLIWIPIVQLVPLLEVAGLPVWFIIGFFIPLLNLVLAVVMFAKISIARGKSGWLVILLFIPIANLIFIPYLAFSD
jgi:uncharacterized membrane-anchored protein